MHTEHLDRALSEEFSGHGRTIHELKLRDPHFRSLMTLNHSVWAEIQTIQSGETPASDAYLQALEKQRLKILDEIAASIARAEA